MQRDHEQMNLLGVKLVTVAVLIQLYILRFISVVERPQQNSFTIIYCIDSEFIHLISFLIKYGHSEQIQQSTLAEVDSPTWTAHH